MFMFFFFTVKLLSCWVLFTYKFIQLIKYIIFYKLPTYWIPIWSLKLYITMCYLFIGFPPGTQENRVFRGSENFPFQQKLKINFCWMENFRSPGNFVFGNSWFSFSVTVVLVVRIYILLPNLLSFSKYFYYNSFYKWRPARQHNGLHDLFGFRLKMK